MFRFKDIIDGQLSTITSTSKASLTQPTSTLSVSTLLSTKDTLYSSKLVSNTSTESILFSNNSVIINNSFFALIEKIKSEITNNSSTISSDELNDDNELIMVLLIVLIVLILIIGLGSLFVFGCYFFKKSWWKKNENVQVLSFVLKNIDINLFLRMLQLLITEQKMD